MQETEAVTKKKEVKKGGLKNRISEFALISRDPILMTALIFSFLFLIVFVFYPIIRTCIRGFYTKDGIFDLTEFARYFDGTILDKINRSGDHRIWTYLPLCSGRYVENGLPYFIFRNTDRFHIRLCNGPMQCSGKTLCSPYCTDSYSISSVCRCDCNDPAVWSYRFDHKEPAEHQLHCGNK